MSCLRHLVRTEGWKNEEGETGVMLEQDGAEVNCGVNEELAE